MTLRALRTGHSRRLGFSVLELLIATTIAMVILLIVTKWFRDLSQQTSRSRAMVEMSGQIRSVIAQLEGDMRGATFPGGALPGSKGDLGYFQYAEGIANDSAPNANVTTFPLYLDPGTGDLTAPNGVRYPNPTAPPPVSTATVLPATAYLQNINGVVNTAVDPNTSRFGDMDDVLCFTTRNVDMPFEGKMVFRSNVIGTAPPTFTDSQMITSPMAEVVWWVEGYDENLDGVINDAERRLHRRTFLIRPDLSAAVNVMWRSLINNGVGPDGIAGMNMDTPEAMRIMLEQCDVSFHIDRATGNAVANTLQGLAAPPNIPFPNNPGTHRPPQCKRVTAGVLFRTIPPGPGTFSDAVAIPGKTVIPGFRLLSVDRLGNPPSPWSLAFQKVSQLLPDGRQVGANRFGDDIMLSSVAAFDARIFDPNAQVKLHATGPHVQPGDPGYEWRLPADGGFVAQGQVSQGAFVDLNYANSSLQPGVPSWFSGPPSQFSGFFRVTGNNPPYVATHLLNAFDTWGPVYNTSYNGVDDLTTGVIGIVDDPTELAAEMANQVVTPPYSFPLRALQVTLRTYDPDSRQIRQLKASAAFTSD